MTTISVPIPAHMEEFINRQIKNGYASNKAEVVRKALTRFSEEQAINDVLEAMKEVPLRGDLRELAKKFKNA